MKIESVAEYREMVTEIKQFLCNIWDKTPVRDRGLLATDIASDINLSKTSVVNYFSGIVLNPETALFIIESYKKMKNGVDLSFEKQN